MIRRPLLGGALAVLAGAALLAVPSVRLTVQGRLRGEPFYKGRPLGHWIHCLIDSDLFVQQDAIDALDALGEGAWLRAMADPDPEIRLKAAQEYLHAGKDWAGERAGTRAAILTLAERLQDSRNAVRIHAAGLLFEVGEERLGGLEDRRPLEESLADAAGADNPYLRWLTVKTLGDLKAAGAPADAALRRALGDSDPAVRAMAALSLSRVGGRLDREVLDRLAEGLAYREDQIRRHGPGWGKITWTNFRLALPALCVTLGGGERALRLQAAAVLGRMGPEARRATPDLVRALKDADPEVRSCAADSLRKIDPGPGTKGSEARLTGGK